MTAPMRIDAREKVTGAVRYGVDRNPTNLAHAMYAVATIAKGRVTGIDTSAAEAVAGVRLVLTHIDESELRSAGFLLAGGYGFQSLQPLTTDEIAYRGQPIALVVADSLVAATDAAAAVRASYDTEPFAMLIDDPGAQVLSQPEAIPMPARADITVGDADAAIAASAVQVDSTYRHPPQNAAPMELLGSVVEWDGDQLTVHEGTQNAGAIRNGLASQLDISADQVQVISPYCGGGFGQKNSLQPHLGPLAVAARRLGRPIKMVLPRTQVFHQGSFRPASRHRIRLGADASGRITGAIHEVDQQTSRHDLFPASYVQTSSRLYGFPAYRGTQRLVRTDVQTPGYMRAPHEHAGVWAFESAMDELAYATGQDPVALRLANDTDTDPVTGNPFSSRHIGECLRRGAERFGWSARSAEPGSMRGDDGSHIGWGVAIGAYPAVTTPATATVCADVHGRVTVGVDGHEMGQGIRSAITLLVCDDLGIPPSAVIIRVGDTRFAPQHLTAGSWGTLSALPAVSAALGALRSQLDAPATGPIELAARVRGTGKTMVRVQADNGQPEQLRQRASRGLVAPAGPVYDGFTTFSFVAHFAEVRVAAATGRVRVPRTVSVVDCGRVASPITAASQVRGGVVWGIGAALREQLETDSRFGGFINATLEEYLIPVNADIGTIDVDLVNRPDPRLNALGVKGLGEISMVGAAAAVANAVYHATGRRARKLPITVADLL